MFMKPKLWKLPALLALVFLYLPQAQAADIVWANAGSGNWSSAANWSPNQVPGVNDNAFITNAGNYTVTVSADASVNALTVGGSSGAQTLVFSGGTFTVAAASAIGPQDLTFSAGTLAGSGDVTITGALTWSTGIMAGAGRTILGSGGTASFSGTGIKGLNRTFENSGTVNYTGTALTFGYTATVAGIIDNLAGGVFNATGEGDFLQSSAAAHAFNNSGTFNKSGAGTTTDFTAVAFNNAGSVNVNGGTLNLNSGGSNTGLMDVATATTLSLAGSFNNLAGGSIAGAGNVGFPSGTHNLVGPILTTGAVLARGATLNFNAPQTLTSLSFSSGTLQGSGDVTISGSLNWTFGIMAGAGRTILGSGGAANFSRQWYQGIESHVRKRGHRRLRRHCADLWLRGGGGGDH